MKPQFRLVHSALVSQGTLGAHVPEVPVDDVELLDPPELLPMDFVADEDPVVVPDPVEDEPVLVPDPRLLAPELERHRRRGEGGGRA